MGDVENARRRLQWLRLAVFLACAGASACAEPPAGAPPSFEQAGEWIDVQGYDVGPEDTCAGTLVYLDDYAGALSQEFGVNTHLGIYRWYEAETFADQDPCDGTVLGCAGLNGVFTKLMPHEHEIVHIANYERQLCPLLLSEGLAEYYSTVGDAPSGREIGPLLADPNSFTGNDYDIAGAFVAMLVESHGLEAVLEVCERGGFDADGPHFAAALEEVLGVSAAQLEARFTEYDCGYDSYRSKLYECGQEPAVVVGADPVTLDLTLDCADAGTIGPRWDEIWSSETVRVTETAFFFGRIELQSKLESGTLEIIPCAGCVDSPRAYSYNLSKLPLSWLVDLELEAGDYMVRVSGPPEVATSLRLSFF